MTEVFGIEPTRESLPAEIMNNGSYGVNFSVCFAAGENWSLADRYATSSFQTHLDWLAIAAGGLRLNTPSEVAEKIAGRGRRERSVAVAAAGVRQREREAASAKVLADMGMTRV